MTIIKRIFIPLLRNIAQKKLLFGNSEKALKLFNLIYQWSPSQDNQFNVGLCLLNLRRYEEALSKLEPVYTLLSNQLFPALTYSQCLLLLKKWEKAEQIYLSLTEHHPNLPILPKLIELCRNPVARDKYSASLDLQFQATLLIQKKKYKEAKKLLQVALELTPDDAVIYNNIGAVMLKLKYPPEDILAYFAKAIELNPDNDQYKRNYRRVWLKTRN